MSTLRRLSFIAAATTMAFVALPMGACGSNETSAEGSSGGGVDLGSVIYEGQATDEALRVLLDAAPKDDPSQGTVFDEPADGAALAGSPPPSFRWHVGGATGRAAPPLPAGRSFAERLLGSTRTAYAHGAPLNGRAYFLVLSSGDDVLAAVFTTDLKYTPDADGWSDLIGVEGPIQVTMVNAIFENNRLTSDGGPFVGQTVSFTIL